jgi:hypothetical protein
MFVERQKQSLKFSVNVDGNLQSSTDQRSLIVYLKQLKTTESS